MADKPIIFSAPMVRALLDGTKTQTRRELSLKGHRKFSEFGPSDTAGYDWHFRDAEMRWHDHTHASLCKLLRYAVGDRLYVREAWRTPTSFNEDAAALAHKAAEAGYLKPWAPIQYEADGARVNWEWADLIPGRYRHARFMPRWVSRLTLTVTDARVERLQEISEADAAAEGVWGHDDKVETYGPRAGRTVFRHLWCSLHGDDALDTRPWAANPWVAAYTFTVRRGDIDQMPGVA